MVVVPAGTRAQLHQHRVRDAAAAHHLRPAGPLPRHRAPHEGRGARGRGEGRGRAAPGLTSSPPFATFRAERSACHTACRGGTSRMRIGLPRPSCRGSGRRAAPGSRPTSASRRRPAPPEPVQVELPARPDVTEGRRVAGQVVHEREPRGAVDLLEAELDPPHRLVREGPLHGPASGAGRRPGSSPSPRARPRASAVIRNSTVPADARGAGPGADPPLEPLRLGDRRPDVLDGVGVAALEHDPRARREWPRPGRARW